MSYTDPQKLQKCFDSLWMILADKQAGRYETVSFRHGIIDEQEGYKHTLCQKGRKIISDIPWTSQDIIGSGQIVNMALQLLGIRPNEHGNQQNLVDYRDIGVFSDLAFKNLRDIETALYFLYAGSDDALAFKMLTQVLKKRYTLISYFFFMKDPSQYQVVRSDNFKIRFPLIGAPIQCVTVCTWENYKIYNSVLKEVQTFLSECLYETISLTDAHSFVWMFWMLNRDTASEQATISKDDCTTVYISAKEGRKIVYYTSKYERNPKLRAEAIRLHGYSCAVCGFNFENHYGELGKSYIEVHHTKPLFSFDGEIEVDPDKDMVCLCANCHRMIHRKRNAILTVSELQKIMSFQ